LTTTQNARASSTLFLSLLRPLWQCAPDKTIIYDRAQLKNTHGRRSPHYEALGYKFILIVPAASPTPLARTLLAAWLSYLFERAVCTTFNGRGSAWLLK